MNTPGKSRRVSTGATRRAASVPPPEKPRLRKTLLDCVLVTPFKKRRRQSETDDAIIGPTLSKLSAPGDRILRSTSRASLPPASRSFSRSVNLRAFETPKMVKEAKEATTRTQNVIPRAAGRGKSQQARPEKVVDPLRPRTTSTSSYRSAKRPRLSLGCPSPTPALKSQLHINGIPGGKGRVEEDFGADFQMLRLDDVIALPWVPVSDKASVYVPPGVHQLISNMKRALESEGKARRKAEERYLEEMRKRIAIESEVELLRASVTEVPPTP